MHYSTLEPFGVEQFQLAELCSMFYNVNRKKGSASTTWEDHLPWFKRVKKTTKQIAKAVGSLVSAFTKKHGNDNREISDRSGG